MYSKSQRYNFDGINFRMLRFPLGLGYSSVAKHLLSTHEALGSIFSTTKEKGGAGEGRQKEKYLCKKSELKQSTNVTKCFGSNIKNLYSDKKRTTYACQK